MTPGTSQDAAMKSRRGSMDVARARVPNRCNALRRNLKSLMADSWPRPPAPPAASPSTQWSNVYANALSSPDNAKRNREVALRNAASSTSYS